MMRTLWSGLVLSSLALLVGCSPFTKITGDKETLETLEGSWTVMSVDEVQDFHKLPKPAVVVFAKDKTLSGFDGVADFKGTYSFSDERLTAKVSRSSKAAPSEKAGTVRDALHGVFSEGGQVVQTSMFGGRVLQIKNDQHDVRFGRSDQLDE